MTYLRVLELRGRVREASRRVNVSQAEGKLHSLLLSVINTDTRDVNASLHLAIGMVLAHELIPELGPPSYKIILDALIVIAFAIIKHSSPTQLSQQLISGFPYVEVTQDNIFANFLPIRLKCSYWRLPRPKTEKLRCLRVSGESDPSSFLRYLKNLVALSVGSPSPYVATRNTESDGWHRKYGSKSSKSITLVLKPTHCN